MRIDNDGESLRHKEITQRPEKEPTAKTFRPGKTYIPPKDHPWRKRQYRLSRPLRDGSAPITE
ncbi:MAG: hypothetical protein HY884_01305 [Deltaproteobacteria bacterium]|nr:hypothetical protein [Deltaproteobacteria bacterium]